MKRMNKLALDCCTRTRLTMLIALALAAGACASSSITQKPQTIVPTDRPPVGRTTVSTEGRLFVLREIIRKNVPGRPTPDPLAFPAQIAGCGGVVKGWVTFRGSWWVAVDSVADCRGVASNTVFRPPTALTAVVDSGVMASIGYRPDTLVLNSSLHRSLLPTGRTLALDNGLSLIVFALGDLAERSYSLARP
jgi:hypothetical protein